ncbi:ribosome recycling factor [Stappia sp.]|uniref:ribosome recycling factor n=1 Tax=Stappia sp. TaxID=1870903 RepID=UPI003A99789E
MADQDVDYADLERRMTGALNSLKSDLGGLRTGRASSTMLDPVTVEAYGSQMPLNQVATVSVPEPRMISVAVWDKTMVGKVERAIRDSNLGLNPVVDGMTLRLPIPELNEERRKDLIKLAHKYAEQAKVAVRHVRRDGMDTLKKLEKDGDIGEDQSRVSADRVQKMTDEMISEIDSTLAKKEQEISQV